ncbi:MAG: hypothetical protein R2806_15725 [Saprospiraceae bacterium]
MQNYREKQYEGLRAGLAFHAGLNHPLIGRLGCFSQLTWQSSGGRYAANEESANYLFQGATAVRMTYLGLASGMYYTLINQGLQVNVQLAPRLDYLLTGASQPPLQAIRDGKGLNRINWGITPGLTFGRRVGEGLLGLQLAYQHRFRRVVNLSPRIQGQFEYGGAVARDGNANILVQYSWPLTPRRS